VLRPTAALVVSVAALVCPTVALAYDTGPHADLTRDALTAEGFGAAAADAAAAEHWFSDFYSQADKNPYSGHGGAVNRLIAFAVFPESWSQDWLDAAGMTHFDSTKTLDPRAQPKALVNTPGVEREWLRVMRNTRDAAIAARQANDPLQLIATIGISLHSVQDFYTHSNWVEPAGTPGFDGPGWTARGYGDHPTWFDLPKGERDGSQIEMSSSTGARRKHGGWRDDDNQTLTTADNKDSPGRPLFQSSYVTAYFASRQWIRALRTWVADDALWARAQRIASSSALARDVNAAKEISLYSGRWAGGGGPCVPDLDIGTGILSCGPLVGAAGDLINLRQAINRYFDVGPSVYRRAFQQVIAGFGADLIQGEPDPVFPPVASSAELQAQTQFVQLEVTRMQGISLGDPGPDDADLFTQGVIAGQRYDSTIIHGHDSFSFPRPYHPFTWLRAVPVGARFGQPVRSITLRVHTADTRSAGTDDDVDVQLGPGLRLSLQKRAYDDFERDDDDTYSLPIDQATRSGLTLGDITQLQILKSRDGLGGAWRLGGVQLVVNDRTLYRNDAVNRWLQDDHRTWTASGLTRDHRTTPALPVWLQLREDDLVYGADDVGDVNPYDRRTAEVVAYTPGTTVTRTVTGGDRLSGRLALDNGDKGRVTYRLTTVRGTPPPPLPTSGPATVPPVVVAEPTVPSTPTPPTPTARPDLVLTALDNATFTVGNAGAGAAGPFSVTVTGFPPVRFTTGLAAGASATRTYTSGCIGGVYTARADSLDEVTETVESNNTLMSGNIIC
jgi:hypothetical protein